MMLPLYVGPCKDSRRARHRAAHQYDERASADQRFWPAVLVPLEGLPAECPTHRPSTEARRGIRRPASRRRSAAPMLRVAVALLDIGVRAARPLVIDSAPATGKVGAPGLAQAEAGPGDRSYP